MARARRQRDQPGNRAPSSLERFGEHPVEGHLARMGRQHTGDPWQRPVPDQPHRRREHVAPEPVVVGLVDGRRQYLFHGFGQHPLHLLFVGLKRHSCAGFDHVHSPVVRLFRRAEMH